MVLFEAPAIVGAERKVYWYKACMIVVLLCTDAYLYQVPPVSPT